MRKNEIMIGLCKVEVIKKKLLKFHTKHKLTAQNKEDNCFF